MRPPMNRPTNRAALFALPLILLGALAAAAAEPAPPIPDSRFPSYVKFSSDRGNDGGFATQARVEQVVTSGERSFFMAGFFRPEDYPTWGMLAAVQSADRNDGTFALSLEAYLQRLNLFEWRSGPHHELARAPNPYRGLTHGGAPAAYTLNRWHFIAAVIVDACHSRIFLDGLWSEDRGQKCVPWPSALRSTTFGSYYNLSRGTFDSHGFNGGLRDWTIVTGVPTGEELLRMRAGEDPRAIWPAGRVWGFWNFTTDPATGGKEPDQTGQGRDLTYIGAGKVRTDKPVLIQAPAAR